MRKHLSELVESPLWRPCHFQCAPLACVSMVHVLKIDFYLLFMDSVVQMLLEQLPKQSCT